MLVSSILLSNGVQAMLARDLEGIGNMQEEVSKQFLHTLEQLGEANAADRRMAECSFKIRKMTLEEGVCTYYGACRFQGHDFMNQVILRFTHPNE